MNFLADKTNCPTSAQRELLAAGKQINRRHGVKNVRVTVKMVGAKSVERFVKSIILAQKNNHKVTLKLD